MISQRQADADLLASLYARSTSDEPVSMAHRVRNRLTVLSGHMTVEQFHTAVDTLLGFRMIEREGSGDDQTLRISDHGAAWLLANFHWIRGDDDSARLEPNHADWVMAPPKSEHRSLFSRIFGAKKN